MPPSRELWQAPYLEHYQDIGGIESTNFSFKVVFTDKSHFSNLPASWLDAVDAAVKESVDKRINHLLDLMGIP